MRFRKQHQTAVRAGEIQNLDSVNIENVRVSTYTVTGMKTQAAPSEKMSPKHKSNAGLTSKMYPKLLKANNNRPAVAQWIEHRLAN